MRNHSSRHRTSLDSPYEKDCSNYDQSFDQNPVPSERISMEIKTACFIQQYKELPT